MPLTTRIRDDIAYGYAVGRVRVLEGRLLSRATFERLLDAPDLREQKRILAETHVGRYLDSALNAADVERALDESLSDLYDEFLEKAGLPAPVVDYFQLPHDFANLRTALKARVLGVPAGYLSPLGTQPHDAFVGDGLRLDKPMRDLLVMFDDVEEIPALDEVDSLVDRALFAALLLAAKKSHIHFLRDLTVLRIDLANARLIVRARAKSLPPAAIFSRLIPAGSREIERIAEGASKLGEAELADALASSRALRGLVGADVADVERFDLAADALVANRMLAARRQASGPEPVLAYVLGREAEVLQLRTVLVGMLAGVDRETLRARLKERSA